MGSYDLSWGLLKPITHPVPGNHEYLTHGGSEPYTGCDATNAGAAGYFKYFGSAAGSQGVGYYAYDVGSWRLIALNSNCGDAGGCSSSSPQGKFLAGELAAFLDADLAVADLSGNAAGRINHELLANGKLPFEHAPDLRDDRRGRGGTAVRVTWARARRRDATTPAPLAMPPRARPRRGPR